MASTRELELRDYLQVLWRRKVVIVVCALAAVGLAVAASLLQTPVYEAKAEVLLQQSASDQLLDTGRGQTANPERLANTELQVLRSPAVTSATDEQVGHDAQLSASIVGESDVLQAKARSTDPDEAAADANAYADSYIALRQGQVVEDLLDTGAQIQAKIDEINGQLAALAPEAETERLSLESQRAFYRQQLDQVTVAAGIASGPVLLTSASPPADPVSPQPIRNAVLALILGLALGVGLAFLLEYLDDSVKTKDDLEHAAGGVAVVGLIPTVTGWKDRTRPVIASIDDTSSPAAEAYRTLRTSVQFLGLEHPIRTLQITSASASEAKTTTLANLGVALARAGQRVVMVCCDLRKPRLHEFFGLSNMVGLTSVIVGDAPLSDAMQPVPDEPRLALLASGPQPPNPSELLGSQRTRETLAAMQAKCDIVLVDSPPVLPVTDAIVLSGLVDATLLVATAGASTKKGVHRAVELLRQVDAPLVGTVLNGTTAANGYGYGYGYGYGSPATSTANGSRRRARTRT